MEKLKPILPSLRERKRYLAFEVISESDFSENDISKAIISSVKQYIGNLGLSKSGLIFIKDKYKIDTKKNTFKGIVKVSNKYLDDLKMSIISIKEINKKPVLFRTLGVSGVLKKSYDKYVLKVI